MNLKRVFSNAACLSLAILGVVFVGMTTVATIGQARTQVDDNTGSLVNQDESQVTPEKVETPDVKPVTQVGPAAAEKYFRKNRTPTSSTDSAPDKAASSTPSTVGVHYLALGIGGFLSGESYSWGATPHNTGAGRLVAEMTYKMGPLSSLADWSLRVDYMGYGLPEGNASQLAFSPIIVIPESNSKFPLYFGLGAGPGVFLQQVSQQSSIAINYQIFGGIRFFDVLDNTGFFLEAGLKNHFLLTSQGQFNGTYLAAGAVFTF